INNIVVSQHPTTSTCTDSNIGLIQVTEKDADDFIQVPNHFTLSSDKIHDLVNRKDDSSSKSLDSSAGFINEINMCTLESNATTNTRNNNDENIDASSGNNTNLYIMDLAAGTGLVSKLLIEYFNISPLSLYLVESAERMCLHA
ncbi:unnamed protein product, partial [Rotaria sp. Silwood1]